MRERRMGSARTWRRYGGVVCAAMSLLGCPNATVVKISSSAPSVHSGETATLTANVVNRGTPVPSTTVTFTSSNVTAGTVAPATSNTDVAGDATSTFTGGTVSEDTPVEVTAKRVETDKVTIIVQPAIGFDDFGGASAGTTPATAQIVVTPSLKPGAGPGKKLLLTYVITLSGANVPVASFGITFPVRVTVTAPTGAVGINDNKVWQINWPTGATTLTVIGNTDAATGGTAAFDFLDKGPPIKHANVKVAGPK